MKRYGWSLLLVAGVMLLLPWLAVTFVPGDAGMAVCFILFFVVNPMLTLGMGALAGIRRQWFWPVATAGLFLLGAWLAFSPGEGAFLLYAGVYLALGAAAMLIAALLRKR